MPARYAVSVEPERSLIRMMLAGFFDPVSLVGFQQARNAAHARLRCGPNRHDTLVDVRDLQLQTQQVVEAFRFIIAQPGTRARRLAIVTGDAAVRMQVRRVANRDDIRCFPDMAAAERWLAEPPASLALAG